MDVQTWVLDNTPRRYQLKYLLPSQQRTREPNLENTYHYRQLQYFFRYPPPLQPALFSEQLPKGLQHFRPLTASLASKAIALCKYRVPLPVPLRSSFDSFASYAFCEYIQASMVPVLSLDTTKLHRVYRRTTQTHRLFSVSGAKPTPPVRLECARASTGARTALPTRYHSGCTLDSRKALLPVPVVDVACAGASSRGPGTSSSSCYSRSPCASSWHLIT